MKPSLQAEIDRFLGSEEADFGFETLKGQQLLTKFPLDDDETYKYFSNILLRKANERKEGDPSLSVAEHAARSYRAMIILKQDMTSGLPVLIRDPTQAGLLMKDLLNGLSAISDTDSQRYSTYHIRELLDTLVEKFPEKAISAAAAGGSRGVQEHLGPLLHSDQTLSVLTHLVCIGATGRKGIASAEKSAQHTAMYHHIHNDPRNKVSLGQRRKFVMALSDFALFEQLADALTSKAAGEELCDCILTIVEVVGYPPEDSPIPGQQVDKEKGKIEMVGEDDLLAPLGISEWWGRLFQIIRDGTCSYEQREAIARVCYETFALATGNSTRICKSHAPATDATEQTSEKLVEEHEENVVNRLVEWGLTDKMHEALRSQLNLLIHVLDLPTKNILSHQATIESQSRDEDNDESSVSIRHPGRYRTRPLGSWRSLLISLLKEILTYKGDGRGGTRPCSLAMDAIMELPVPPEIMKAKKGKDTSEESGSSTEVKDTVYNPWPALCSFVWAYPNNDFYHITFFQMLQSVVLEHHEASLRLILQKSKFLSRSVSAIKDEPTLRGVILNCLNLFRLRSKTLSPSAFLHQYLDSHDGWKENIEFLTSITETQQKPIKGDPVSIVDLDVGSPFALKLGLNDIDEWDASTATTAPSESSFQGVSESPQGEVGAKEMGGGSSKKKKNKKKKKK